MIVTKLVSIPLNTTSAVNEAYLNIPWKVTEIRTRQMTFTGATATPNALIVFSNLIGNESHGLVWNKSDQQFSQPGTTYRFRAPIDIQGNYLFQLNNTDRTPYIATAGEILTIVLEFDECTDVNFPCKGHMGLP